MRLGKIFVVLLGFVGLFLDACAMEGKQGRTYDIGRDIGFRWRTTLSLRHGSLLINSDEEHERLSGLVASCDEAFRVNGANVSAASLQVVFKDSFSEPVPIEAVVYTRDLQGIQRGARVSCFSTACLTIERSEQVSHPPITYKSRDALDRSIPFIFGAIGMDTDCIKAEAGGRFAYNYRDTEFQIVCELFFKDTRIDGRFTELFESIIGDKVLSDVSLIVLHIHTKYDPCAVCAEMLCKLSQTLNYRPEKLI